MDAHLSHITPVLAGDTIRHRLADGTQVLKLRSRGQYLALAPGEQGLLERFDGRTTVQGVLTELLDVPDAPAIRRFYQLIDEALREGFLIDPEATQTDPGPSMRVARWCCGWRLAPVAATFLVVAPLSAWAVLDLRPAVPYTLTDWVLVFFAICVAFSVGNVLAGLVLAGYGADVYNPGMRIHTGLPVFHVDTRDAAVAGRRCEAAIAIQQLVVPCVLALVAYVFRSPAIVFAACFVFLAMASPFTGSPAHALFHALLLPSHRECHFGPAFLCRRLFRSFLAIDPVTGEQNYLILHACYALAWLGAVMALGADLLLRQNGILISRMAIPADPATQAGSLLAAVFLLAVLLLPLLYEARLVVGNVAALLSPFFSALEHRLSHSHAPAVPPPAEELTAFLRTTLLFGAVQEEDLPPIVGAFTCMNVPGGTSIIRQGTPGDALFVVYRGTVSVIKEDTNGQRRKVAELGTGDVFGEIALLDRVTRTASVKSAGPCVLLALSREHFDDLLVPSLGANRIRLIIQTCSFLKRTRLFADWPDHELLRVAADLDDATYSAGQQIIAAGQPNDTFYLIYEGECDVRRDGDTVAALRSCDFFGEISLLKGTPTVADVVARTPVRCLTARRDRFVRLITEDVLTGITVEQIADTRLRQNQR